MKLGIYSMLGYGYHGYLAFLILYVPTLCQKRNSQVRFGTGVADTDSALTIHNTSLLECRKECKDRSACAALDYIRQMYICKLYSQKEYANAKLVLITIGIHEILQKDSVENSSTSLLLKCDQSNKCVLTGCALPEVANGTIRGNMPWFGSRVLLTCNDGFVSVNESSAVCIETGVWSYTLSCIRAVTCGPAPIVENAIVDEISSTLKRYQCLPGYVANEMSDFEISCMANGSWTPLGVYCLKTCDQPMTILNANLSDGLNVEGSIRTYACRDGYSTGTGSDAINITCGTDGTWTAISFKCLVNCEQPMPLLNANISDGMNVEGSTRTYACRDGFSTGTGSDAVNITCGADGKWTAITFGCLMNCKQPMTILNANISHGLNIEGSTRTYACRDGYSTGTGSDAANITCGADGKWTAITFECFMNCGDLPNLANGRFTVGLTTAASQRIYVCNDGYMSSDGKEGGTIMCNNEGFWEPNNITCLTNVSDSLYYESSTQESIFQSDTSAKRLITSAAAAADDDVISPLAKVATTTPTTTTTTLKPIGTLGVFCMDDADCIEVNSTCFRNRCFCKPMHDYSAEDGACFKTCSHVLDTFTEVQGTYIGYYWSDKIADTRHRNCESTCVSNKTCLFYEHLHGQGNADDCRIGTLSLTQFKDAYPGSISYPGNSKLYVRDCQPIGATNDNIE